MTRNLTDAQCADIAEQQEIARAEERATADDARFYHYAENGSQPG